MAPRTECKVRTTRPEWRTAALWSGRARPESARSGPQLRRHGTLFGKCSVAMPRCPCASSAYRAVRFGTDFLVRYGLGRLVRFGRSRGNSFPVFSLLAQKLGLCWIENPRVDGSTPSLATISMNCNGFRASPADHPGPLMGDPRTIGKRVDGHPRGGPSGAGAAFRTQGRVRSGGLNQHGRCGCDGR